MWLLNNCLYHSICYRLNNKCTLHWENEFISFDMFKNLKTTIEYFKFFFVNGKWWWLFTGHFYVKTDTHRIDFNFRGKPILTSLHSEEGNNILRNLLSNIETLEV